MGKKDSITEAVKDLIAHEDTSIEDIKNLAVGLAVKLDELSEKFNQKNLSLNNVRQSAMH